MTNRCLTPGEAGITGRVSPARRGRLLLLAVLICLAGGCGKPAPDIAVTDGRIRALLPGSDRTAAYFDVTNNTAAPAQLTGASSSAARSIELHRIVEVDGMVRMRRQDSVAVAPGETVRFQPGGLHLMVFGVAALPNPASLELEFADGRSVSVALRVMDVTETGNN